MNNLFCSLFTVKYIHLALSSMPKIKLYTSDFFEEWNEITPQIHIRKFKEQPA